MLCIAVIPGEGIGIDVTREAVKLLQTVVSCGRKSIKLVESDFGAGAAAIESAVQASITANEQTRAKVKASEPVRWAARFVAGSG